MTIQLILRWADEHHVRFGRWPTKESGTVHGAPGETWGKVASALALGLRGLRKGQTLAELLRRRRGRPNKARLPRLTEAKILRWADAFYRRTGRWPSQNSGGVPGTNENWKALDLALYNGHRGFPGGNTLAKLLDRERRNCLT